MATVWSSSVDGPGREHEPRRDRPRRPRTADPGDRPRAVRPDRPRAVALAARPGGTTAHGPDPGRPAGQGPALPVHRRPAGACTTPESVRRHLAEYLGEAGDRVPWWLRLAVRAGARPGSGRDGCWRGRRGRRADAHGPAVHRRGDARRGARRPSSACAGKRLAFTADLLGEAVISEAEADAYQQTCLDLIRGLAGPLDAEPESPADRPRRPTARSRGSTSRSSCRA